MQTLLVGRSKIQLCVFLLILVFLIILLMFPRTEVYNYYQQLSDLGSNTLDGTVSKLGFSSVSSQSDHSELNRKYNLMDEPVGFGRIQQFFNSQGNPECTLEYINARRLQQDHPCVIEIIRRYYLKKPSPQNAPYKLEESHDKDPSPGQSGVIFSLLKNRTNGFFVECGAHDGEYLSNTLELERRHNWGGILIEANPSVFQSLLTRNRKAWALPICLSLEPYPTIVTFQPINVTGLSHIEGSAKTLQKPGKPGIDPEMITVQCFPFYSVLLAVGRTQIDFFSLDVEGHELVILKTIPWHKVDIKALTIEWDNIADGKEALVRFMEQNGFLTIGSFDFYVTRDVVFIKDLINPK